MAKKMMRLLLALFALCLVASMAAGQSAAVEQLAQLVVQRAINDSSCKRLQSVNPSSRLSSTADLYLSPHFSQSGHDGLGIWTGHHV